MQNMLRLRLYVYLGLLYEILLVLYLHVRTFLSMS